MKHQSEKDKEVDLAWRDYRADDPRFRDKDLDLQYASEYEAFDWTSAYDPWCEAHEMWAEYETDHQSVPDYWRKAFRAKRLPIEVERFYRNDAERDWYEICVLKLDD